jgi:hypothetical protein
MEAHRFDAITAAVVRTPSRRDALRLLAGIALPVLADNLGGTGRGRDPLWLSPCRGGLQACSPMLLRHLPAPRQGATEDVSGPRCRQLPGDAGHLPKRGVRQQPVRPDTGRLLMLDHDGRRVLLRPLPHPLDFVQAGQGLRKNRDSRRCLHHLPQWHGWQRGAMLRSLPQPGLAWEGPRREFAGIG